MSFHNPFHMKISMFYALPLKPIKIFYQVDEVAWQFGIYLCMAIEEYSSIPSSMSCNRCGNHTTHLHMLQEGTLSFRRTAFLESRVPGESTEMSQGCESLNNGIYGRPACYEQVLCYHMSSSFLSICTAGMNLSMLISIGSLLKVQKTNT